MRVLAWIGVLGLFILPAEASPPCAHLLWSATQVSRWRAHTTQTEEYDAFLFLKKVVESIPEDGKRPRTPESNVFFFDGIANSTRPSPELEESTFRLRRLLNWQKRSSFSAAYTYKGKLAQQVLAFQKKVLEGNLLKEDLESPHINWNETLASSSDLFKVLCIGAGSLQLLWGMGPVIAPVLAGLMASLGVTQTVHFACALGHSYWLSHQEYRKTQAALNHLGVQATEISPVLIGNIREMGATAEEYRPKRTEKPRLQFLEVSDEGLGTRFTQILYLGPRELELGVYVWQDPQHITSDVLPPELAQQHAFPLHAVRSGQRSRKPERPLLKILE